MPPKAKFTRAEIIEAALNIVRTDGYEALTSRALGTYLASSARPIFTVFKNMEEVQQAMIEAAKTLYKEYVTEPLPAKAGRFGLLLKQPKVVASSLISFST